MDSRGAGGGHHAKLLRNDSPAPQMEARQTTSSMACREKCSSEMAFFFLAYWTKDLLCNALAWLHMELGWNPGYRLAHDARDKLRILDICILFPLRGVFFFFKSTIYKALPTGARALS
jgi:hypothetical protein